MTDGLYLNIIDSDEKIPSVLTYAIHKELLPILSDGSKLFELFTDSDLADLVINICLATRNDIGQIVKEFDKQNKLFNFHGR